MKDEFAECYWCDDGGRGMIEKLASGIIVSFSIAFIIVRFAYPFIDCKDGTVAIWTVGKWVCVTGYIP